jgi:hypothetical protein
MSTQLDHFRYGSIALNAASDSWSGSAFGLLVLEDDTEFSTLTSDVENASVLTDIVYGAGTYLPISLSVVDLSAGAVLIGKTGKR